MGYVTATQYAKKAGITRQAVNWRIKKGKLAAKMIGSYYIISDREIEKIEKKKDKVV